MTLDSPAEGAAPRKCDDDVQPLYSIRMRASVKGAHLSGAERIVSADHIAEATVRAADRALRNGRQPDRIVVTVESLAGQTIRPLSALDIVTVPLSDVKEARGAVQQVLTSLGIADSAARRAIALLRDGTAPSGGNMRGAVIMDAQTGERLEPDRERGVRASRFDWSDEGDAAVRQVLAQAGLSHFRTREALALATKIASGPGVAAELCWSDDPDYTAGYVASRSCGYVRFPHLKEAGNGRGGRVIFVRRDMTDVDRLIAYLESEPVLIVKPGTCRQMKSAECGVRSAETS